MHRVILAGGPALVRDAYRHIIAASPAFARPAQTASLSEAVTTLTATTCDLLIVEAQELDRPTSAAAQVRLHQAAARTRVVVLGKIPPSELPSLTGAGVSGVLGPHLEAGEFLTALDVICRGAMVISPAPAQAPLTPAPHNALTPLTRREREVLALVATRPDNSAIADALGVSPLTVKSHVNRIMHKLAVSRRSQLVVLAYESRLVVPGSPAATGAAPRGNAFAP
ncbi:response regulator transcription factor [Streptomyces clavifer]|uniref:response regulator transcription factor n=1 Tax=Streptomyces clavifer TaxID=68188 RepID=UPI00331848D5